MTGVTNTPISPDDMDPCTVDSCDPVMGIINAPINPDDMDICTLDACRGNGVTNLPEVVKFEEAFDNNSAGWTLGMEWQIGAATAGTTDDPAVDASASAANGVAGVNIGGNYATSPQHGYYYIESPVFDGSIMQGELSLEFARWLESDYPPFVTNTVEVFDGTAWQTVWEQPSNSTFIDDAPPQGNGWLPARFNITAHANATMQVRWGFKIESGGVIARGGWSVDDVRVVNTTNAADDDLCTADSCDQVQGSTFMSIDPSDMNSCTVDSCDPDIGVTHVPSNALCDDMDACTNDNCSITTGCSNTPITCDDNNACTTNACNPASGCDFQPVVCDDMDACTIDSCDTSTGCQAAVPTQPHDKCTTGAALIDTPGCMAGSQGVISAVCAADPFCCNNSWDGICVGEVYSDGNSKACDASAGSCPHSLCTSGPASTPFTSGCDASFGDCATQICASDPFCCNNDWDGLCVNQVTTVCGLNCN